MNHDTELREHLKKVLDWEDAHVNFARALNGIPAESRGRRANGLPHTPWQLLEHLRLTQFDILDFCRNPNYVEPKSMEEYWPKTDAPPDDRAWDESVAAFRRDLDAMKELATDASVDLFAKIPHGSGQTYLREVLLVADHNAYHVAQLVDIRRALGVWS